MNSVIISLMAFSIDASLFSIASSISRRSVSTSLGESRSS